MIRPLATPQDGSIVSYDVGIGTSDRWILGSPLGPWPMVLLVVVGLVVWLLLARSSLVRGGGMERPERVPQLYGYSVCLIAIVVMLASTSTIVDRLFTLSDPLASGGAFGWNGGPVLTSYEAYRATMNRGGFPDPGARADTAAAKPSESELHARYEALRADQLARARLEARRDLTSSAILLLVAAALFSWHWRWVRRVLPAALANDVAEPSR